MMKPTIPVLPYSTPGAGFIYDLLGGPAALIRTRAIGQALQGRVPVDGKVLDAGGGTGQISAYLAQNYGYKMTVLDVSGPMLQQAAARSGSLTRGSITAVAGNILDMPVNGPFDAVLLAHVLVYVPQDQVAQLFSRTAQVTKENGQKRPHRMTKAARSCPRR